MNLSDYPSFFISNKYPKSLLELEMIRLSAHIREKSNWATDIKKPKIVEEWKKEFCRGETNVKTTAKSRLKIFDYVLAELQYYISLREDSIEVGGVDGTWQSDDLVQEPQRQQLMDGVKAVELAQVKNKDWLPGSNGQVWALVSPNLYSFVKGKTRVLKDIPTIRSTRSNRRAPIQIPEVVETNNSLLNYSSDKKRFMNQTEISDMLSQNTWKFPNYSISKKFQWLPSEFQVDEKCSVKITSYINNLHPEIHSDLYRSIEVVFQKFIPLFNKVLMDLRDPRPDRVSTRSGSKSNPIPTFAAPRPGSKVDLAGQKLQVIVKFTNIELTPESPKYSGGPWHVEGMTNERIVATGIYYYSKQNITESRLQFRQAIRLVDSSDFEIIYGIRDEDPLNQNLGSIVTKQGRCIVFPNKLQHCVAPFELENSALSGHRKILVFHLVDPSIRILSTALVPPQQKSWFVHQIVKEPGVILPLEVVDKIVGLWDFPISLKEAKKDREELMNERLHFVEEINENWFERNLSTVKAEKIQQQLEEQLRHAQRRRTLNTLAVRS